ncbi:hypothetical protein CRUP_025931 [Coryphaenoides rupestris]|nr:hypothetical protein CRUP_025931 [Coryphaenoides rupestris]
MRERRRRRTLSSVEAQREVEDLCELAGQRLLRLQVAAWPSPAERQVWEEVHKVLAEAVVVLQELQAYNGAGEEIRQDREDRVEDSMGNLIRVLSRDIENNTGNFFLDFENAQPSPAERQVWEEVHKVLAEAVVVLQELQAYNGAGEEIRQAIQRPGEEQVQEQAWAAVLPLVGKLKKFYLFSLKLESSLRCLLVALTRTGSSPTQHLEAEQALARQFAEILHFTLRFDELKADEGNDVNNELANRMSLFYANSTPMLKTLSDGTIKFVSDNPDVPIENTTDCLSTMACVCKVMLETPEYRSRFASDETILFCLRVMVGVIILYDYVHPAGAFVKTSGIDMKGCIRVLKEQPASSVEELLNALRQILAGQISLGAFIPVLNLM